MFWLIFTALLILASLFVVLPLLRHRRTAGTVADAVSAGQADRNAANLAIYHERLAEVEGDLASGMIDADQFDVLKLELGRTLLADVSDEPTQERAEAVSWRSPAILTPLLLLVAIVPLTYVIYQQWGFEDELALRELHEATLEAQDDPDRALELVLELKEFMERQQKAMGND